MKLSIHSVLTLIALLGLNAPSALANGGMIEVGGGVESSINGAGGWNALLRVETAGIWSSESATLPGSDKLILVHVDGEMAINTDGTGDTVPYMNMRFIPISNPSMIPNQDGTGSSLDIQLLPSAIHRERRVGRNYAIEVSLVGVEMAAESRITDHVEFFMKVAADLIGYKVIDQNDGYGTFHAFRLGGATAEVGLAFNISEGFSVRISGGGSSDFNVGRSGSHRGIQSDQSVYARLTLNMSRFIEAFAQIGLINMSDTGDHSRTIRQFMAGVSVRYSPLDNFGNN